ncbi:hypothetical protein FRC00_004306, partial [Tulasnella sp. 408]
YTNITKIDLARLDREASLRLIGVYGSKSEIARFLRSQGSIDDEVYVIWAPSSDILLKGVGCLLVSEKLLLGEDDVSINRGPSLRSGIYVLSPPAADDYLTEPLVRYVIYWPEETTWNDDATGSVRINRVMFMRYLTSLTDQIRALISPEHEAKLAFNETDQGDDSHDDGFGISWNDYEFANVDDRLFKFEVAKTNEQEEAVNIRPGFTVAHHAFCTSTAHIPTSTGSTRSESLVPQFVASETVQAVATTRFVPGVSYPRRLGSDPTFETSVWSLDISEHDRQRLKENHLHIPTPRMPRSPTTFSLPLAWRIRRLQVLGSTKALLMVDCPDKTRLWVFPLRTGFSVDRPTCSIPNAHGRKYVIAVDEQVRLVALVITEPSGLVALQEFLMDGTFSTMHSRGSPLSLNSWYTNGIPEFTKAAFFSGSEELCLVEASGRVRVFSIPSRSFRSSPDGAALLVVEGTQRGPKHLRVFHRESFGSNKDGIVKDLPESFNVTSNFCVSSTGERSKAFLMAFDFAHPRILSSALEIGRKEAEYQFRAKGEANKTATTVHNSLINCFSEVWQRFPVAAAIQRQTVSEAGRQAQRVTFVSSLTSYSFKEYFKRMVQDFERLARKPTEQKLTRIVVDSSPFDEVSCEVLSTSQYKAGEWIAELLCLIPIHIAVTIENRFVPLKDGVLNSALERQLLGEEVSKIINSISLGWYESIFSSYMANKLVKVVSCMGNLERTAQEDMLLVLFNTALSNLIIFRNNFALSRDVANMFTSFQASTHLFDPSANQKLFKGLLAIVIKDVVEADKRDIVKEFFAKFSLIVSREQATNFITVLHNSQLTVIPWSVIQSKEFYALFGKLRHLLSSQKCTHGTAGEFLITLKSLMAKIMVIAFLNAVMLELIRVIGSRLGIARSCVL